MDEGLKDIIENIGTSPNFDRGDGFYVEDFFGEPILICPNQFMICKNQFSIGDGAMLACKDPQSIVIKKCPGYENPNQNPIETIRKRA